MFYENGEKFQEAEFNFGYLDGDFIQWHKNGKVKLYALYDQAKLVDSRYVEYDENGLGALVYNENFYLNKDSWIGKGESFESSINFCLWRIYSSQFYHT